MDTKQFCNRHHITMSAEWADENPNMNGMPPGSSHWKCTLRFHRRRLTTYFSMGPALSREPQAADVLDCLASDACSFDNASSFEEWASEFGYDADSRKAEKTYRVVERQAAALKRLLGDQYDALVYETERL